MKTGKYTLGYKAALKSLRACKSKLVLICNKCPAMGKSDVENFAMLAKTGGGTISTVPTPCGHYYRMGCVSITDPGDSDIIRSMGGDE